MEEQIIKGRFVCYPKEIANRVHHMFTGQFFNALVIKKKGWHLKIRPSATGNGVHYENVKD